MRLFSWFILRRLAQEPLRSATTAVGIALGVAVVIAIQLTNASSLAGFETALNVVSGRTSLEIVGAGVGVDEARLADLGWLRELGEIAPVIEGDVIYRRSGEPAETLRVLGVDILRDRSFRDYSLLELQTGSGELRTIDLLELLRDPASVVLTAKFAGPRGLTIGSRVPVQFGDRVIALTVRGLLKDEGAARVLDGRFMLMDIAAAQEAVGRLGFITRLELRLAPDIDVEQARARIAPRLPLGLSVQPPAQRGRQAAAMLAAFHLNLTALSYVALLVGLFLVYNTVSVAVLSRRGEIGSLRSLGVTRRQVAVLFLGEAAVLSCVGCTIGVGVGRLLADAAVALTSATVSALYIATAAAPPALEGRQVLLAFGIGVPLSLLAAVIPAREASRLDPIAAIRGSDSLGSRGAPPRRTLWVSAVLLALAAWLATLGPVNGLPLFGYGSAIILMFGASFLVPGILATITDRVLRPFRRRLKVEDWLAVTNVSGSIPRLSISVAALAVSLSMMVAIAIMIGSFRETVVYWVGQTLQADLFINPGSGPPSRGAATLSPDVVTAVASYPDVAAVDRFHLTEIPFGDTLIRAGGADFDVLLTHGSLLFKAPADGRAALRGAIGNDALVASESFALKQRLGPGDEVSLPTPHGTVPFRIAAVYYDYSSDRGVLMMDRQTFERHYGSANPSGLSVYLKPGVDPDSARASLLAVLGEERPVFINTNRSVRAEVLRIFDSTFAITYALEIVAILVAVLGVSGTLLTLVLERERELAILRLVGTGKAQIRRMIIGEAVLLGAVAQGVGLGVGAVLSLVVIYVINVQSFGWTIQFHLPVLFLIQSTVAMLVAAALAGLYPARRAVGLTMRREE